MRRFTGKMVRFGKRGLHMRKGVSERENESRQIYRHWETAIWLLGSTCSKMSFQSGCLAQWPYRH